MKAVINFTTTIAEARRLLFFFPIVKGIKPYAGRVGGKHTSEHNPGGSTHSWGRYLRAMPTNNGFVCDLEWSCALNRLKPYTPCFIQVWHLKNHTFVIRVSPDKSVKEALIIEGKVVREIQVDTDKIKIAMKPSSVVFQMRSRDFTILKRNVPQKTWDVWMQDAATKCDHFLVWNEEEGKLFDVSTRQAWLEARAETNEQTLFQHEPDFPGQYAETEVRRKRR